MPARNVPRPARQPRSAARSVQILDAAEALLVEGGLEGFSIPILAERLGFPRATVYNFFPTPFAVLNQLAVQHLDAMEAALRTQVGAMRGTPGWRDVVAEVVRAAAAYYDRHPGAAPLLLGGPVSDSSYRAMEYTIDRLGNLTRQLLDQRGQALPPGPPDVAALAVEFGTASFRLSYFHHGRITREYADAAAEVMVLFLQQRLQHG